MAKGRYWMLLVCLSLFSGLTRAQITVNSGDLPAIGQSLSYYFVSDSTGQGIPVNVGNAGANQVWSFDQSAYPGGYLSTVEIVDPASTPFAASFPGSNWGWKFSLDTASTYIYFENSPTTLKQLGIAFSTSDTTVVDPTEDPDTILVYPLAYNTSWSYTSRDSVDLGQGLLLVTVAQSQVVVDAWGTVQLPAGTFPALRVREDRTTTQTLYFNGFPINTDQWSNISYQWVSDQGRGLLVTISSLNNETNPNFTRAEDIQMQVGPVGIEPEPSPVAERFELLPAFPNPFNPTTTVSFRVPIRSRVTLTVYSVLGQPVKTLMDGVVGPGRHQVQWDGTNQAGRPVSSGIYLVEMRAGTFQQVIKVVLNR
ncbi:MAG: T9SS C-terminal target domain-containing protein [Calditrichaeota bacterium]|nr:MAG: T9SS C-terminal target domain-containing protein [Calditrichota bacterium]